MRAAIEAIAGRGDQTYSQSPLKQVSEDRADSNSLRLHRGSPSAGDSNPNPQSEPQEMHAYDLDEIQLMLSVMPEPAATIFAVAAFTGLRRSELQGLRWEDYQSGQIRVSRSIWEGHVSDPKTGSSKGAVPIIKQLIAWSFIGFATETLKRDRCFQTQRSSRTEAGNLSA
jgi:integrase